MTLRDLLTQKAKLYTSKTCIKFESRSLSYSEIDRLVTLYAGGLVSAFGAGEETRVLFEPFGAVPGDR